MPIEQNPVTKLLLDPKPNQNSYGSCHNTNDNALHISDPSNNQKQRSTSVRTIIEAAKYLTIGGNTLFNVWHGITTAHREKKCNEILGLRVLPFSIFTIAESMGIKMLFTSSVSWPTTIAYLSVVSLTFAVTDKLITSVQEDTHSPSISYVK